MGLNAIVEYYLSNLKKLEQRQNVTGFRGLCLKFGASHHEDRRYSRIIDDPLPQSIGEMLNSFS